MKYLTIKVGVPTSMSTEDAQRIVDALIQVGIADAAATVSQGEGNLADATSVGLLTIGKAELLNSQNAVQVACWYSKAYGGENEDADKNFNIAVTDQRETNGQMFIDFTGDTSNVDDLLAVTLEVNNIPGSDTQTQCCHLHFDGDNCAASIFKVGDKFFVRPETDVTLTSSFFPNGEPCWVLESTTPPK